MDNAPPVLVRNARVLTLSQGPIPRRGQTCNELCARDPCDVLTEASRIAAVGPGLDAPAGATVIEAAGRVLVPGFVDAHTHACWAGDRVDEWESRLAGVQYTELLRQGGGIMNTVRAVRGATEDQLVELLLARLSVALRHGTTALEIKSGYGLDTEHELKMLRAIRRAGERWPGRIVPTACIGHALDPAVDDHVDRTIAQTLPAVHEAFPGVAIDAYCERGAWELDDCVRLLEAAAGLGHPIRVHADQFNALGMVPAAIRLGARSVDHLEASRPDSLRALARSDTAGVFLPAAGFHLDNRYADARAFLDADGIAVVATNWNPGSAPCASVPMAIALAVRGCGMRPTEAITAATVNGAWLLGLADAGRIEPGLRADLVLLEHRDERELAHSFGYNAVAAVVCGGRVIDVGAGA